jgi:hypothetical protein
LETEEGFYSLNVSLSTVDSIEAVGEALAGPLLDLKARIIAALTRREGA